MWTFDAPAGVYKDAALSSNIRQSAIADVQTMKFLTAEPGFGKGKGQSITIVRILQLPLAGRVSEQDRLPSGRPAIQTKSVTVSEWGFKIPVTEFEQNLTQFNILNQFQKTLKNQMSLTMDVMGAAAFKSTPIKFIPKLAGSVIRTDGTTGGNVADKNLDISDLRQLHDYMYATLKTPTFRGGKYVGILSTQNARGIKNDPVYEDWLAPSMTDPFVSGQMKDVEGFLLYESNNFDSFANLAGTSVVSGESVFFGDDGGFLAVVQEPELRAAPVAEDLGRFRETGWVGEIEAGLTWEQAAQARVIHVTSA